MKLNKPLKEGQVRDHNDRYETPRRESNVVLRHLLKKGLRGTVLEPACGTGRIVRAVQAMGLKCEGRDIEETGDDFLKLKRRWRGPMVSNPPYHHGMALAFVAHACEVVDGPIAMLLQGGFMWGEDRSIRLRGDLKPQTIIIIPWRVYFYKRDGTRIKGQAYNHAWFIWPDRQRRPYVGRTEIIIAE